MKYKRFSPFFALEVWVKYIINGNVLVLFYPSTVVMLNISFTTHFSNFYSAELQLPVVSIISFRVKNSVDSDQMAYLLIMLESLICEHHFDIKLRISGVVITVLPPDNVGIPYL